MLNINKSSVFIIIFVLLLPLYGFSKSQEKRNVLYVSSFTYNNSWSINCKEAMMNKFKKEGYTIYLKEIYLDEKSNSEEKRIEIIKNYFSKNKEHIDVIIAFDYGATNLFLTYTDSIISKIPIVFVSELETERTVDFKNITGITSDYGIGRVYKNGLKIFPNTRKVYVWADKSPTGEFFMKQAKQTLCAYENEGIEIEYGVDAKNKEELLTKFRNVEPYSFILFSTWQVDDNGQLYISNDLYPEIIKSTKVPIFTVFDGFIGSGFIGGFVQVAKNNGEAAALKSVRIFNGEIPEKISIDNIPPVPLYDYAEIVARKGVFAALPENTVAKNIGKAFFNNHKILVTLVSAIIIFIISILILRYKNIILNKKIKFKEEHEKDLQLNIKLLSSGMPSVQILSWDYNERTNKYKIGGSLNNQEKGISQEVDPEFLLNNVIPEQREEAIEFFHSLLTAEDGSEYVKEYLRKFDEKENYSWWETRIFVELLEDKKGKYRKIRGINFNIDKHKNIEQKLNEALKKSIQSDILKSRFIANISHEIRTPLNAILGFTELVIDSEDREEQLEYRKIIRENNEKLLNLVEDIIELSEIESGFIEFKRIKFDLKQFFEEFEGLFKYKIKNGVDLIVDSPHKSCIVFMDKQKLTQILKEIVENSIKFTNSGHIKFGYEIIGKDKIKFYIEDTGIGVKEKNISRVFDRFEKLDSFEHGPGLGLAIIKALLDNLGAKYSLESKEGVGTKFWAILSSELILVDDNNIKETNVEIDNYISKIQ